VLGRVLAWSGRVIGEFGNCGDNGELGVGNENFRPPNGEHCDRAPTIAFLVASVIVEMGDTPWLPLLREDGVSGPAPRPSAWLRFCEFKPGTSEGLTELRDGGGVEK
jgi:hypothetical protein